MILHWDSAHYTAAAEYLEGIELITRVQQIGDNKMNNWINIYRLSICVTTVLALLSILSKYKAGFTTWDQLKA